MLTIFIPLFLLLITFKQKWNQTIIIIALIIVPSAIIIYSNNMPVSISNVLTIDIIRATLIILTIWIIPIVIAASQKIYQTHSSRLFLIYIIVLTLILLIAFSSSHILSFYILFEASLIPTLLIVIKWGYQPERLQAGIYLMLYTITASLPLLAGISIQALMFDINHIFFPLFSFTSFYASFWLVINIAFIVKLPLFTFHLWLPKAHVEAPVAGSIILAAVLLKLGGYGILRVLYLIPPINPALKFYLIRLALWGGIITSLICVRQQDIKSLIAYSSVGHIRLVIAGVLSNVSWGIWGALSIMISHGLLRSAIFASADICYSISNSRSLIINKGLNISIPTISIIWFIICAANIAAPPSTNLLSEIILITCSTIVNKIILIPLGIIRFVAAAYSLTLYVSINHGPINSLNTPARFIVPRNITVITGHVVPVFLIILIPSLITLF